MRRREVLVAVYRKFLMILLGGALLLAGVVAGGYHWEKREFINRVKVVEKHNIDLQQEMISQSIDVIRADLLFLARQNELIQLLETKDAAYRKMIAEEYVEFSRQRGIYDQVRFINAEGMEVCRVNYEGGNPVVVPEDQLQSKKGRYYFDDSLALDRREIFVSPMDLNIEQGTIEVPLKPMIRFGTPVYDLSGGKRGVVVLNYLGSNLLQELEEMSRLSRGQILLVNRNGYWLKGLTPEDEWGFMYDERENRTFQSLFPATWQQVSGCESFQAVMDQGLFTATTIRPLGTGTRSSSGCADAVGKSSATLSGQDYYWKLISYVPEAELLKETRGFLVKMLWMAGFLFVASVIPAFLLAQAQTRQAKDREALIRMANFDKLTGLANRSLFLDRLDHTLKRSKRYKTPCALLFVDLDGFKEVNDTLGHEAGDAVLIETGERFTQAVRESDMVARHGGDEFTVILPMVENSSDAEAVAEKIIDSLSRPFELGGEERVIGASIGIGVFPEAGETVDELLHKADSAMYEAKAGGKNRWVLYKPEKS
ncbi:GGDEF domain-containing protein [Desulfoluna limicola]|uniref:GGDEF domain-containing protein n=1 Tax=Desulfoluna limicola TaxID=2810562 RepID=A0ABM7PK01_9BACT|nr:sensor domain-containing diguanylate cyclase [Desulfoluna limicola]BCS97636.1 GGDEF domain-containing protein [Desulfoluna limicola]